MPDFIVSYDLKETHPDPHAEFVKQAEKKGWSTWVRGATGVTYKLPNTTIEATFQTRDLAEASFLSIAPATRSAGFNVVVAKWILADSTYARFASDKTK